jgi:hypothetical protein
MDSFFSFFFFGIVELCFMPCFRPFSQQWHMAVLLTPVLIRRDGTAPLAQTVWRYLIHNHGCQHGRHSMIGHIDNETRRAVIMHCLWRPGLRVAACICARYSTWLLAILESARVYAFPTPSSPTRKRAEE